MAGTADMALDLLSVLSLKVTVEMAVLVTTTDTTYQFFIARTNAVTGVNSTHFMLWGWQQLLLRIS